MSAEAGSGHPQRWEGEAGARRLLSIVRASCPQGEDLPTRLGAGLRAALGELAADPELASLLSVEAHLHPDEGALDAQREWTRRFGAVLRDAAASEPRASAVEPSFLAPFLIDGVRFQIGRMVIAGEASDLLRILPQTLAALLAYYFEPGESRALARAALGGPQ